MLEPGKLVWKLPCELVGTIVTENLPLQDISRLDVACCLHNERALYLEALRSRKLSEITAVPGLLYWIMKRNLKVGTVRIQSSGDADVLAFLVNLQRLFEVVHLSTRAYKPSELQHALLLLSEIENKVSCISVRRLPTDDQLVRGAIFRGLVRFEAELRRDSSEWVANVITQNTRLQTINVIAREPISASIFAALSTRRSTLKSLSLMVGYDAADPLFVQVADSCPNLRSLTIGVVVAENGTPAGGTTISQGLVSLSECCPDLSELKVVDFLLSDAAANVAMLRGLRKLCILSVVHTVMWLSDGVLQTLAECRSDAPFLTELEIMWNVQRTDTVAQAAVVLANLRRLVLHTVFPPPPVDALRAGLAQLSRVEDLTLKILGMPAGKLLSAVAQGSPYLRSISVDCGWQDSAEAGLIAIARHCPLLEIIHMDRVALTDSLLQALARHCPQFRALCKEGDRCTVTTAGLLALVEGCPLLTTLDVRLCTTLNDTVLQTMSAHSYYLEELSFPKAYGLSEEALEQLVVSCKHLRRLWLPPYAVSGLAPQRLTKLSRSRGRTLKFFI
jgi:hypothetical protein